MTQVFAHRGYSGYYPENTMIAFQKAVEAGVQGIELDVQCSKDFELMIIHDEELKRTTNGSGYVKDFTKDELKQLDASAKMYKKIRKETCSKGSPMDELKVQKIPTLREYFEFVKDKNIITNIELKTSIFEYEGIEEKVIQLVDEFNLQDNVWYSSFNHYTLLRCQAIRPNASYGFLIDSWNIDMGSYTKKYHGATVNARYPYFKKEIVDDLHQHGIGTQAWTSNTNEALQWLIKNGVDVLITNYPERAFQVLESMETWK